MGREPTLRRLEQAYTSARAGQGSAVLIVGEPGIGKSRLLQEFVTGLMAEATIIVGAGYVDEQELPYGLLVEALAARVPRLDLTGLGLEPLELALLAGLWPDLLTPLPELPPLVSMDLAQKRTLLFQALVRVLLHLASRHPPLLLCVDNLHWADESTLAWLGCLARHLRTAPILLLGAYRPEEAATVAPLRTELVRLGLLQELNLTGLAPPEIVQLMRHLSGQEQGAEKFSQHLHRETGGNPFFLLEMLHFLFETGLLGEAKTGWSTAVAETTSGYHELPLPGALYEVVRARLGRLSPQSQQVLQVGAVIGSQFEFDLIQAASGRAENEVVEALEILQAWQILTEQAGRYRFNHDLIRAVVYHDLSYGRRRWLHRQVGEALQKLRANHAVALT